MLVDYRELQLLISDLIWVGIALFIAIACSYLISHIIILPLLHCGGVVGISDKRLVIDVFKILHVLTEHVYVT